MAKSEHSVDVNAPVREVYNQWTQFEQFPQFMDGVEQVTQLDDKHLHWKARIAGKTQEWDADITEQLPDQRIAWHSVSGDMNAGVVTFHRIDGNTTRVMLQLEYVPEGAVESAGSALGFVDRQVKSDLERFKDLMERQQRAAGGWRGTIEDHPDLGAR
ncbi:MAG TPA: SRPBCC family protein [Ktedonobacterales bacterium]